MHLLGWTNEEIGVVVGLTEAGVRENRKNFNIKLFTQEYASGLTPEQIATNHNPVSPVDIWSEYARLKSLGWTQQRIAKAKGIDQATVSRRLKFNSMSDKVKDFMRKGLVDEFHLAEIITLCAAHNLSPWLTTSQVWEELAEKAVHPVFKRGGYHVVSKTQTIYARR